MSRKGLKQKVRAALNALEFTSTVDVAAKCGITPANALYYLNLMVEAGEAVQESLTVHHIDSNASSRRYTYRLNEAPPPEPSIPPTPAPYRNLRLTENLTGYENEINRFWSLCMLVRK